MQNVAFLRGINVGGRTIRMVDLRSCFSDMDLADATTVLQTGNVVFTSSDSCVSLKRRIEVGLRERFHFPAKVQVHRMATLHQIIDASPFDGRESHMHSYVIFFENGLEEALLAEATDLDESVEQIEIGRGVLYWRVPKGSTLNTRFAKYLTMARYRDLQTSRNINTLRKIVSG